MCTLSQNLQGEGGSNPPTTPRRQEPRSQCRGFDVWYVNHVSLHLPARLTCSADETDADFWQEVKEMGWSYLDHTKEATLEKHGEWYLSIIGQVAQSMATGFVGTEGSTFSLVAARRVEDWNNGISVLLPRKS